MSEQKYLICNAIESMFRVLKQKQQSLSHLCKLILKHTIPACLDFIIEELNSEVVLTFPDQYFKYLAKLSLQVQPMGI